MDIHSIPYFSRFAIACYCLIVFLSATAQRDCVISTYTAEIGVHESGHNRGDRVKEYQKAANIKAGEPWCAAFVTWCHKQCGVETPNGAGYSPNWFPKDKIISVRGKGVTQPQQGDVIGIYFPNKGRIAHVGFYVSRSGSFITTVEGNTGAEREGDADGVYKKKRIARQVTYVARWIR